MKKFPHQQFIDDNNLDIQTLPEMLQKRIKGFDELEEDLQHTTDEDKEKLMGKLETLSHELAEDLEEHFEEHLENNDQEEDEQPELTPEHNPVQEPEVQEPEVQKEEVQPEIAPEPLEEVASEPQEETPEPILEPVKEPTDEEILEGLFSDKKHLVLPSELKGKGFKIDLNSKRIVVGKFCLYRGKYDTCYKIVINQD